MKKNGYKKLKNEIDKFISGDISWADLKHTAAPFGIYQQRNGLFMIRIRIVGGELTPSKVNFINDVMNAYDVGYAHFTTRQDIQFHDVKTETIHNIVLDLTKREFPFRGGGGNTLRNIIVSTESGISQKGLFDVYPYAKALNKFMLDYDKAFDLPRKFKIGFASSESDSIRADLQDLGFIAREYRGKKGFKVYAGGGMGRDSRFGVKLFDFIPPEKIAQCSKALTELFYDHGDRSNRNRARLRFVLNRLGEDGFINLFSNYYLRTSAELPVVNDEKYEEYIKKLKKNAKLNSTARPACPVIAVSDGGSSVAQVKTFFEQWKKYAVSPTRFGDDIVSVKLFVPSGNLNFENIQKLIDLIDGFGIPFLRISQTQDMILPMVHESSLISIYSFLKNEFENIDLTLESFKGHILSCIGSSVCKIGIVNAPGFADRIAVELDDYFKENPEKKSEFIRNILQDIKISGCPNSCSGHFSSKLGLCGIKKKIDGELVEGAVIKEEGIEHEKFVPLADIPDAILDSLNLK